MEMFTLILDSLQKILIAGGALIMVINGVSIAVHIKESQGTQLTNAGLGVLGGVLLILCAGGIQLIKTGLLPPSA